MAARRLFHFSTSGFGRPFEAAVAAQARRLHLPLTLVLPDPVKGMGAIRRRRTRTTRPIRQLLESARRRHRVRLVEDVNAPSFRAELPAGSHGLSTGFSQIFKRPVIDAFESLVNLHPSLLPYYRGPDPFHWLAVNGETRSGYTLHLVTEAIDAGPIIFQEVVEIAEQQAWQAIVTAAVPRALEWVGHLAEGTPFPRAAVDARSVYRVALDYGPLLPHRRRPPRGRVRAGRPRRVAALLALCDALQGGEGGRSSRVTARRWQDVLSLAEEQKLSAWLWSALGQEPEGLPAAVAEELRRSHVANTVRNMRLRRQLVQAIEALNGAGITPLLLKGAVQLLDPGEEGLGARWMSDIDLAVPPDQLPAAVAALELGGFRATAPRPFGSPHEIPFLIANGPGPLELHHELGTAALARVLPLSEGYAAASELALERGRARRLSPTHELLHDVLHSAVQDHEHALAGIPLRQLLTVVRSAQKHGSSIDWIEIQRRMSEHGLGPVLRDHLWLAHRLLGMELADSFDGGIGMRMHAARALLSFGIGWPAELERNLREAFGAAYMDHLYEHGGVRWRLALARARHALRIARQARGGALQQALRRQA